MIVLSTNESVDDSSGSVSKLKSIDAVEPLRAGGTNAGPEVACTNGNASAASSAVDTVEAPVVDTVEGRLTVLYKDSGPVPLTVDAAN